LLSTLTTSPPRRFETLDEWLDWQQGLHPKKIDLGLDRIRQVLQRMGLEHPSYAVVTIGGTNGKGSSVALLESISGAAGYRTGAYTSPHLLEYNERVRIDRKEVGDQQLCQAFERIDQARGDISLTYFEFATLAAFEIFHHAEIDLAILEVGMGGRLDAVNVLDSDVALVTTVDIDHASWLGGDRETIGWEKAGIFRHARPAVCGDPMPPETLVKHAAQLDSHLYRIGHEFAYDMNEKTWSWRGAGQHYEALPYPSLHGQFQLQNAACVIMVLELLKARFRINQHQLAAGLENAVNPGRFQIIPGEVTGILDVAHNPHGARALAQALGHQPCAGKTHAVLGMLADKNIKGVIQEMMAVVDSWYMADLTVERGAPATRLVEDLKSIGQDMPVRQYPDVMSAWQEAHRMAQPNDRVVVFGSFYTVADVLRHHRNSQN